MKQSKILLFSILMFIYVKSFGNQKRDSTSNNIQIGVTTYYGNADFLESDLWYNHFVSSYKPKTFIFGGGEIILTTDLIKNKYQLETGVGMVNRGFIETMTYNYKAPESFPDMTKIRDTHYFLTIPVRINFKFNWFYVGGGISGNYFLKRWQVVNNKKTDVKHSLYGNYFMLGGDIKTGAKININNDFSLTGGLYGNLLLSPLFINYGVSIGVLYDL